jgi:hypothetical protein
MTGARFLVERTSARDLMIGVLGGMRRRSSAVEPLLGGLAQLLVKSWFAQGAVHCFGFC